MSQLHTFTIIGRVGKINKVGSVLKVNIASEANYKDKDTGEWVNSSKWNTVTIFGENSIKYITKHVEKGDLVQVTGELYNDDYEKDGQTIYTVVLRSTDFNRLVQKAEQESNQAK